MSDIIGYGGGKSGGGSSSAREASDSLHSISYAKVLDLVSEGEIQGLANGLKSVYFDQTPLQNADGSFNFNDVSVDVRPGTQHQDVISGFPGVENEITVGTELRADTPWVHAISNIQLSAVRIRLVVTAISNTDTSNGTINPAWVFYDLVLNDRYGLGHRLDATSLDKWSLYQIARYCDVAVPDGRGGTEPRFTCNLYLQSAADAYKILQDLASIFRGISYWAGGSIMTSADMPADPAYIYTAANVIDGKFTGAGSSHKSRFTVALVSWNDPNDFYKAKVEYVQDDDGVNRYGVQKISLTAFGCTSQGQAQRFGNWALLTSRLKTDTLTFSVGLDGLVSSPGQLVRIADPHRMGRRNAGRIRSATANSVILDKAPVIVVGDQLTVMLPDATS